MLKEIEEFNTYLNNDIIDDLPCASHHLLMFIPPDIDSDFMDKHSFSIPTYIEYSSHSRGNNKCSLCNILSCDKPYPIKNPHYRDDDYYDEDKVEPIYFRELSVDNSLYSNNIHNKIFILELNVLYKIFNKEINNS